MNTFEKAVLWALFAIAKIIVYCAAESGPQVAARGALDIMRDDIESAIKEGQK